MALRLKDSLIIRFLGDGVSTEVTVNILRPPINAPWSANLPSSVEQVVVQTCDPTCTTATGSISGSNLTLVFGIPVNEATVTVHFLF